jgi:hypothetical protein
VRTEEKAVKVNGSLQVRLTAGVRLGDETNSVVHCPGTGSFHVDAATMRFLQGLTYEWEHLHGTPDPGTRLSLAQLMSSHILDVQGDLAHAPPPAARYAPHLADLVARRESELTRKAVSVLAGGVGALVTWWGVMTGLLLLVVTGCVLVVKVDAADVASVWLDAPLISLLFMSGAFALRLLLHEAGHYAVARRAGCDPAVGWGIHATGPVLYVDLSALDTVPRSVRLRADLAGLAVDGYLLTAAGAVALLFGTHQPLVNATMLSLVSVALASANPMAKSDVNWALRDALGARQMTAAWSKPRQLWAHAAGAGGPARYARVLLGAYAVYALVIGATTLWWAWNIQRTDFDLSLRSVAPLVVTMSCAAISLVAIRKIKTRARTK